MWSVCVFVELNLYALTLVNVIECSGESWLAWIPFPLRYLVPLRGKVYRNTNENIPPRSKGVLVCVCVGGGGGGSLEPPLNQDFLGNSKEIRVNLTREKISVFGDKSYFGKDFLILSAVNLR